MLLDGRMPMDGWVGGCVGGWMDRWLNELIAGWMQILYVTMYKCKLYTSIVPSKTLKCPVEEITAICYFFMTVLLDQRL